MTAKPLLIVLSLALTGIMGCTTGADIDTRCNAGEIYDDTRDACVPSSL